MKKVFQMKSKQNNWNENLTLKTKRTNKNYWLTVDLMAKHLTTISKINNFKKKNLRFFAIFLKFKSTSQQFEKYLKQWNVLKETQSIKPPKGLSSIKLSHLFSKIPEYFLYEPILVHPVWWLSIIFANCWHLIEFVFKLWNYLTSLNLKMTLIIYPDSIFHPFAIRVSVSKPVCEAIHQIIR